jgi:hypothetical protein
MFPVPIAYASLRLIKAKTLKREKRPNHVFPSQLLMDFRPIGKCPLPSKINLDGIKLSFQSLLRKLFWQRPAQTRF